MSKQILDPDQTYQIVSPDTSLVGVYLPYLPFFDVYPNFMAELAKLNFVKVEYISQWGKRNRTPRKTWAFAHYNAEIVSFQKRGHRLNFRSEKMPTFLEELSDWCRDFCRQNLNVDPEWNSVIIGQYDEGEDHIAFHTDTESFLKHFFCVNITLGTARDFQFKFNGVTHEIKLKDKSAFFFYALEHSLPKRAAVKKGQTRWSISFRTIGADIGVANMFYYCRGLAGAIDDEDKKRYETALAQL